MDPDRAIVIVRPTGKQTMLLEADRLVASSTGRTYAKMHLRGLAYSVSIWGMRINDVRHAIALDEMRDMFPLSSVLSDPANPRADPRIVEMGFPGAHSDVGGGYDNGDRSNWALMWMHDEGVSVGVPFGPLPLEDSVVRNPTIHDERGWWGRRNNRPREIYYY